MWLTLWATPPRLAEAARWAQQAADAGDGDGARVLGWCYYMGNGVPQDLALAAKWYVEAARQGSADAMYQLSLMSRDGAGVPQDTTSAAGWMQRRRSTGTRRRSSSLRGC
jgi:TPR repeat protein